MVADNEQVLAFLKDPDNFLYSIDLQNGLFEFVSTTRSELSTLSFLDQRTLGKNEQKTTLSIPQVLQAFNSPEFQAKPSQASYLFHTAFCCSTLIARCLDVPGKNLSLKEPRALVGVSAFKRFSPAFNPSDPGWKNLRDVTLFLLSRPFQKDEKILMKPSNGANNIVSDILDFPETDKVLFLYNDLESFLISILRGRAPRANWVMAILNDLIRDCANTLPKGVPDIGSLTELQKVALTWGMQMQSLKTIQKQNPGQNIRSLKSTEFLQNPEETLEKLNDFYELGFSEAEQAEILNGPAFHDHAKNPGSQFSGDQQKSLKEKIVNSFGEDIQNTLVWAKNLGLAFEDGLSNKL